MALRHGIFTPASRFVIQYPRRTALPTPWRMAFFKLYYPLEFYTAWLNAMPDRIPSAMLFEGIKSFDAYTA